MISPDHTKKITWIVCLVSALVIFYMYFNSFQQKRPFRQDQPHLVKQYYREIKVLEYGSNRIGDIDKFLFEDGGIPAWLHFPPHTAKFVMRTAPGNMVATVTFVDAGKKSLDNRKLYELISVKSTLDSFSVHALQPPPPEDGKPVEFSGTIVDYKLDEKGLVAGFTIDRYIIEMPRRVGQNIVPMLKKANRIVVKGYERSKNDGFVNTSGLTLIKPYNVMIDETNYVL